MRVEKQPAVSTPHSIPLITELAYEPREDYLKIFPHLASYPHQGNAHHTAQRVQTVWNNVMQRGEYAPN
jgi:hypothetical protein